MSRDELIEALAAAHNAIYNDTPWEGLTDGARHHLRWHVEREAWPLIVAFVGEWIDENCSHMIAREAAGKWRTEMSDA